MTENPAAAASTALGPSHGYCLDGDFVHLNADFSLAASDLSEGGRWALQLWANESGFGGRTLNGIKVAELPLQSIAGHFNVGGCVAALPPAGNASLNMALALVGETADGKSRVADLAIYTASQHFSQPQLSGTVDCHLADDLATITVDGIANPRSPGNLSGTLALEVWALETPYDGGAWVGMPVASLVLGQLAGGDAWSHGCYEVPAAPVPAGRTLTVMLREWTPSGYLTRDYRNLQSAVSASPKVVVATVTEPTANTVKRSRSKKAEVKPAAPAGAVSVNTASAVELAAIKGLSKPVAKAIIEARPYATLDDLVRAKGVGAKLLEKLRKHLTV